MPAASLCRPATNRPACAPIVIDFLLSPEGQKIFEEKFRFATSTKNYGFKRWYPEKGMTLEQYEKAEEHWKKLLGLGAAIEVRSPIFAC